MHNPSNNDPKRVGDVDRQSGQLVYVIPERALRASSGEEVDLISAWMILWKSRKWIIATTAVFAVAAGVYALTLDHWFRAEVLLAPTEERAMSGLAGQLGGIASLAGIKVGADGNTEEAIAVLESRDFTRQFIEEQNLLPILYSDAWDADKQAWKGNDPEQWPDMREAIKFFNENVVTVEEDRSTGLITLWVDWKDPDLAAKWATLLVNRLNAHMRARSLKDAEVNVAYLRNEIASTNVMALQQSIGRLLESELQKLMLAKGNEEFAFRVIDSPQVPFSPFRPSRKLIVVLAALVGGLFSSFFAYVRHYWMNSRAESAPHGPHAQES